MQQGNATAAARPQGAAPQPAPAGELEMELQVGVKSDVGPSRELNEDYAHYCIPTDDAQRQAKGCLFIVADGMGGHKAGEVASHEAVSQVMRDYYADTTPVPGDSLARAVKSANRSIYDYAQGDPSKSGMGTTLVAAVLLGTKVYVANVGDSRAYVVGKRGMTQITQDHSWVEEQVQAGLLTRDEAGHHPQRNLLTRALGTKASVEVDVYEGELNDGQALLLCSDGAHGPLTGEQMAQAVRSMPPAEAAATLVQQAAAQHGEDNSTVLIVKMARPAPRSVEDETPTQVSSASAPDDSTISALVSRARQSWPALFQNRQVLLGVAAALVFVCLVSAIALVLILRPEPKPEKEPGGGVQVAPTATATATTPSPALGSDRGPASLGEPATDGERPLDLAAGRAGAGRSHGDLPRQPAIDDHHLSGSAFSGATVTQPRNRGRNL